MFQWNSSYLHREFVQWIRFITCNTQVYMCTSIRAKSSLFPSTKHQSFNQYEHKGLIKKVLNHSKRGEAHKIGLNFISRLTFIATNDEVLTLTGPDSPHPISVAEMGRKEHLAQNSQPPRHLLTQIMPKMSAEMRDLTSFTITDYKASVRF